jgi:hypothetical protein
MATAAKNIVVPNEEGTFTESGIVDWRDYIRIHPRPTTIRPDDSVTSVRNASAMIKKYLQSVDKEFHEKIDDEIFDMRGKIQKSWFDAVLKNGYGNARLGIDVHFMNESLEKPELHFSAIVKGLTGDNYNISLKNMEKELVQNGFVNVKRGNGWDLEMLTFECERPYLPNIIIATLNVNLHSIRQGDIITDEWTPGGEQ